MRSEHLFSGGPLCMKILSQSTYVEKPILPDDKASQKFFEQIHFPAYSQMELRSISMDLESGMSVREVLIKYSFAFPFYLSQLDPLLRTIDKRNVRFTSLFVLYTYLSWIVTFSECDSVDPTLTHLLAALASVSDSTVFAAVGHLRILAISAFTDLYTTSLKTKKVTDASDFLSPLYLFFEGCSDVPEPCYEMLCMVARWIGEQDREIGSQMNMFFLFVSKLQKPEVCYQELTKIAVKSVGKRNSELYLYLPSFTDCLSQNFLGGFLSTVPMALIQLIENEEVISVIGKNEDHQPVVLREANSVEVVLRFQTEKTFLHGLCVDQTVEFPKLIRLQQLLGDWIVPRLSVLAQVATKNRDHIRTIIVNFAELVKAEAASKHIYDIIAVYLYLLRLFPQDLIYDLQFNSLFNDVLFNPRVTVFDEVEGWQVLNSLRFYAMETIIVNRPGAVEEILTKSMRYPLLFTEILHRFNVYHDLVPSDREARKLLARGLMSAALFYRSFAGSDIAEVQRARAAIFFLISHLFLDHSILTQFFDNHTFSYSFLSFVFEQSLRKHVLEQLLVYLTSKKEEEVPSEMAQIVIEIVESACVSLPQKEPLALIDSVLGTINDAMMHNRRLIQVFEPLTKTVLRAILPLDGSDESQALLENGLQFMALTSGVHTLKSTERDAIETAVRTVYGGNPSQKVFERLVQLSAGEYLQYLNPSFHVRQYKVLKTFVSLFANSDKLADVLVFLKDLCSYAVENAIWCNKSELDLWIIEMIQRAMNDPSLDRFVEPGLQLLTNIALRVSSVSVVLRFIQLLCPTTSQLSIYHEKILKTMDSIIGGSTKEPIVWMQMSSEFKTHIDGVTGAMLEDGFAFVCWVKLDTSITQYKPRLIRIIESDQKGIDMFFNFDQLNIEQQTDEYSTNAHIDIRIPNKSWTLITIKYEKGKSDEDVVLSAKVNMEKWESIDIPNMKWRPRASLKIDIGNLREGSLSPEFPSKFAGFAFMKTVSDETIESFWEAGPTSDFGEPKDYIFSFQPILQGTDFGVDMYKSERSIQLTWSYPRVVLAVPFTNILIYSCKIDLILPLFLQLPMKTADGKTIPHFLDMLVDMLANLLALNRRSEVIFLEYKGFGVISSLLLQLPPELIDYGMYNLFFGLIGSLTIPQLQEQLIDQILLNLDIWMLADAENHLRIIKHWYRVLFPSYSAQIAQVRPFADILACLNLYYSRDSQLAEEKNLDVYEIRNSILYTYMSRKFTRTDILSLIGNIISTTEPAEMIDLLKFFIQIMERDQVSAEDIGDAMDASTLFVYLLNVRNEDVRCLVFDVIFTIHRKNLIQGCPVHDHIRVILHQLTSDFLERPLFRRLTGMMLKQGYYELLTIVSWMALNLPDVEKRWFINRLVPSKAFCTDSYWAFWTLLLATRLSETDLQRNLLLFAVISESENWMNIYETVDSIGVLFDVDVTTIKQLFLDLMVDTLLEKKIEGTPEQMSFYFKTVTEFIMCHKTSGLNKGLDQAYLGSPFRSRARQPSLKRVQLRKFRSAAGAQFKEQVHMTKTMAGSGLWAPPAVPVYVMPFQLAQKFRMCCDRPTGQNIGLRISLDEHWLDAELAKKCVQVCGHWNTRYLEFDLIMCLFLFRMQPQFVMSHLNGLNLTPRDVSENQMLLGLLSRLAVGYDFKWAVTPSVTCFEGLNQFMSKLSAVTETGKLKRAIGVVWERSEKMLSMIDDVTIEYSRRSRDEMATRNILRRHYNAKLWQRLWKCMTVDTAPWCGYKYKEKSQVVIEDTVLCGGICPMKFRRVCADISWSGDGEGVRAKSARSYQAVLDVTDKVLWEGPARFICRSRVIRIRFLIRLSVLTLERASDGAQKVVPFNTIVRILQRSKGHRPTVIEFFLSNGKSFCVDFGDEDTSLVLRHLKSAAPKPTTCLVQTSPWSDFVSSTRITEDWVEGKLSNFKYLSLLNLFSGRSFGDLTQYPLFPWVLSDYSSETLDLSSPSSYRDLRKPMVATNQKSLNDLITASMSKHYDSLILQKFVITEADVCGYMSAFAPFNKAPSSFRLKSIQETFVKASTEENECRELIPEMFALPELLNDVELPKWCSSPMDFIYLHRKALESEYVSQNLNHWIDLVWGLKQRGAEADISFNSFPRELYDDFDITQAPDTLLRTLKMKGVVPHQIFHTWHPKKQKQVPPTLLLDTPITVKIQTTEIMYAYIRSQSPMSYSITCIDSRGSVITSNFDFLVLSRSMRRVLPAQRASSSDFEVEHPRRRSTIRALTRSFQPGDDLIVTGSHANYDDMRPSPLSVSLPQVRASLTNFSQYISNTMLMSNFIVCFGSTVAIVNAQKRHLDIVDTHSGAKTTRKYNTAIACIAEHQGWLVLAGRDPIVSLFNVKDLKEPRYSMPLYRDQITCCAVSATFQLIATGTRDGYVVLSSMNRGAIDCVIDLEGCRPYAIAITESWGFVVVCTTMLDRGKVEHILHVYNVSGTFIRKKSIGHQMNAWTNWASPDGFDFMMIATEKGKLFWFEVYYLDFKDLTEYRQTSSIVAIHYSPRDRGVVIVGCCGGVHFIPFLV